MSKVSQSAASAWLLATVLMFAASLAKCGPVFETAPRALVGAR